MRAGKLDRTITLQRKVETVTASGAVSSAWTTIATPRAEIVQLTANEFQTAFGEADTKSTVFRIRYVANLTTSDQVTYDGQAFDLKQIVEIGRKRGLELHCEHLRQ